MIGTLYIIATPIGNLEDMTMRGIRVLREADLIVCEDTRKTSILLRHYDIKVDTLSYHQHSDERRRLEILKFLMDGKDLALVTDAGTPGISDPGNELIDFLFTELPELRIIPIPGVSAITTALSVSGFDVNKFVFLGFLPKKKRTKLFEWLKTENISFAFFESPYRILKTLDVLVENFGEETRFFIAREMTKIHETLYRGTLKEVKEKLVNDKVKGEIVVVVEQ